MRTSCEKCVFALYEGDKMTDEGCFLGRIEKFEGQGVQVDGVERDGKKFTVIDRFCNACHESTSPYLIGSTLEDWKESILEYVQPRVTFIITADVSATYAGIADTIDCLHYQEIKPVRVILAMTDDCPITRHESLMLFREADLDPDISTQVIRAEPMDETYNQVYKSNRINYVVDLAVEKLDLAKDTFYAVVESGDYVKSHVLEGLNVILNHLMVPISVILPTEVNPVLIVATLFHRHDFVAGNRGVPLLEKLPEFIDDFKLVVGTLGDFGCE